MSRQHLVWWHLSRSGISQLLLTRFWQNFNGSFLGPCLTNAICHKNICLGNICSCDICSDQQYLRFFLDYFFNIDSDINEIENWKWNIQKNVVLKKSLEEKMNCWSTKKFLVQKMFGLKKFWSKKKFWSEKNLNHPTSETQY